MKTGGFEVSNAYNWNLDQWAQILLNQLGESISTAQLFTTSCFTAQNILKDYSGFQGVLSALGGISRNYFAKNLVEKITSAPCDTIVVQKTYTEEHKQKIAAYLNDHARIILPKASFLRGELSSPRYGSYTSKMMAALAKKGDSQTLNNIQEMRRLVSQMETALLSQDILSLTQATARYTDLRTDAQATFLQFAFEAKNNPEHPYRSFFIEAKQDPFLNSLLDKMVSQNITDFHKAAPYLGDHFELIELARKHQVSCVPNGAGGFHCSWAIFGEPQNLQNFLKEAQLDQEISLELYEQTLAESKHKTVCLKGIIPTKVNAGPGVGTNQDFIDIYGSIHHTLPLCPSNNQSQKLIQLENDF